MLPDDDRRFTAQRRASLLCARLPRRRVPLRRARMEDARRETSMEGRLHVLLRTVRRAGRLLPPAHSLARSAGASAPSLRLPQRPRTAQYATLPPLLPRAPSLLLLPWRVRRLLRQHIVRSKRGVPTRPSWPARIARVPRRAARVRLPLRLRRPGDPRVSPSSHVRFGCEAVQVHGFQPLWNGEAPLLPVMKTTRFTFSSKSSLEHKGLCPL